MVQWLDKWWHQTLGVPFWLSYRTYGNGDTTIVLLHGLATDGSFWQPLLDRLILEQSFRVIVPDLLGHGVSPSPSYIDYSVEDQVRAVSALLRRLRAQRVILVGHSMGCLVATRYATQYPDNVNRLLLYEPPLFTAVAEFKTRDLRQEFYRRLYERIAQNPVGKFTTTQLVARVSRSWQRYLQDDRTWLPIQKSLRNGIIVQRGYEELRDMTIRTDIVQGRLDVVVPPYGFRKMLTSNTNIKFYRTVDGHRLSKASATMLVKLLLQSSNPREEL